MSDDPITITTITNANNNNSNNEAAVKRAKSCKSAIVPSLDHLTMSDYNTVYEPSDDTFLLLDALAHEFDNEDTTTQQQLSINADAIQTTLEIGCGTGVNTIYLAQILGKHSTNSSLSSSSSSVVEEGTTTCQTTTTTTPISTPSSSKTTTTPPRQHYVTDINKDAIRITLQTAAHNHIPQPPHSQLTPTLCDLATPLLPLLQKKVDILLFNPPYVPTPNTEVGGNSIEASWAGGVDGRVVVDRALPQIAELLSWPDGVAYVITVDENRPGEICEVMEREYGILGFPLMRRRARNEFLTVLKFVWARVEEGGCGAGG